MGQFVVAYTCRRLIDLSLSLSLLIAGDRSFGERLCGDKPKDSDARNGADSGSGGDEGLVTTHAITPAITPAIIPAISPQLFRAISPQLSSPQFVIGRGSF